MKQAKMYMSLAQSLDVSLTDNFRKLRSSLESLLQMPETYNIKLSFDENASRW